MGVTAKLHEFQGYVEISYISYISWVYLICLIFFLVNNSIVKSIGYFRLYVTSR